MEPLKFGDWELLPPDKDGTLWEVSYMGKYVGCCIKHKNLLSGSKFLMTMVSSTLTEKEKETLFQLWKKEVP